MIAVARLVDIVLDETVAIPIAIGPHDASITMTELGTDLLLVDPWRIILVPTDATKIPIVAITLPQRIPMPTGGPLMNVAPETFLLGMGLIHAMDMRASMSAAGVTDLSTA